MAIDYDLQIESQTKPETVLKQIIEINGFQQGDPSNDFFTAGLVGGVRPEFEQSQNLAKEDFGFVPTVRVWFTPYKDEREEIGMRDMMKAVMKILQQDSGNAALTMNGDYIVLTRINDKLNLNSNSFGDNDEKWWQLKRDVPFPSYEIKEFE